MVGSAQKYWKASTLTSALNPGCTQLIYPVRFWNVIPGTIYIPKHLELFGLVLGVLGVVAETLQNFNGPSTMFQTFLNNREIRGTLRVSPKVIGVVSS